MESLPIATRCHLSAMHPTSPCVTVFTIASLHCAFTCALLLTGRKCKLKGLQCQRTPRGVSRGAVQSLLEFWHSDCAPFAGVPTPAAALPLHLSHQRKRPQQPHQRWRSCGEGSSFPATQDGRNHKYPDVARGGMAVLTSSPVRIMRPCLT